MEVFRNRTEAGRALARELAVRSFGGPDSVVLALPRGGVPVAEPLARALGTELDILMVRKLRAPGQPELAIGAVADGGVTFLLEDLIRALRVGKGEVQALETQERAELVRLEKLYRHGRVPVPITGRVAVLVDDGLATGATMRTACQAVRLQGAARIVVAVPVAARQSLEELRQVADDIVCVALPRSLGSVGAWYTDFSPVTDSEMRKVLEEEGLAEMAAGAGSTTYNQIVSRRIYI